MWLAGIVFLFALAALFVAIRLLRQLPDDRAPAARYHSRGPLLTAAERTLFEVLQQAAGARMRVFAKVRAADVLAPDRSLRSGPWQRALRRIGDRHLDFLLCDRADTSPLVAIALDDAASAETGAHDRDAFLDAACASAGLPVLRVRTQESWSVEEIAAQIEARLRPPEPVLPPSVPAGRSGRIEPRL